jgi:hypothetical protein
MIDEFAKYGGRTLPKEDEFAKYGGRTLKEDLPTMFGNEYRRSSKPNRSGKTYAIHDPTWTDRGKELLQGVGGGLANIPDLASNYVAAPVTFLGSKYAKAHGKLLNSIGAESLAKYANNVGEDLQNLSDKYWNQNLSDEIKNSKELATKNRDEHGSNA